MLFVLGKHKHWNGGLSRFRVCKGFDHLDSVSESNVGSNRDLKIQHVVGQKLTVYMITRDIKNNSNQTCHKPLTHS